MAEAGVLGALMKTDLFLSRCEGALPACFSALSRTIHFVNTQDQAGARKADEQDKKVLACHEGAVSTNTLPEKQPGRKAVHHPQPGLASLSPV